MLDKWQSSSYQIHALTKASAASILYSFPTIEHGDNAKTNACIDMLCPCLYKQNRPLNAPNPFTNLSLSREPYSPGGWPLVHPTRTRRCSPRPTRALNQIRHPNSYPLRDAKVYGQRLRRSAGVRPRERLSLYDHHCHH